MAKQSAADKGTARALRMSLYIIYTIIFSDAVSHLYLSIIDSINGLGGITIDMMVSITWLAIMIVMGLGIYYFIK